MVSLTARSTAFRPSFAASTGPFWQITVVVNRRGAGLKTAACLIRGVVLVRKDIVYDLFDRIASQVYREDEVQMNHKKQVTVSGD